jgi:AcrR family transcriptional regulator
MASMNSTPEQTGTSSDVRRRLLESAALLLDEEGPDALTARRLAAAANTSTMAVYTHFGGMPALVREIVVEGFRRLADHVNDPPRTDDPVADLVQMAFNYRANARENPHLYSVMFGATSLGGYQLAPEERAVGYYTFVVLSEAVARAMDLGALRRGNADLVAQQLWTAMHGYVMLDLAGLHLTSKDPEEEVFRPLIVALLAGLSAQDG